LALVGNNPALTVYQYFKSPNRCQVWRMVIINLVAIFYLTNFGINFKNYKEPTVNEQNLNPFKPGESGNPNGRPKGSRNRATIAREVLEMARILPKEKFDILKKNYPSITNDMSVEKIASIVLANNAIGGDANSYKALMDSAYGAPIQEIDGTISGNIILSFDKQDEKIGSDSNIDT
jgi:hypothetical protein